MPGFPGTMICTTTFDHVMHIWHAIVMYIHEDAVSTYKVKPNASTAGTMASSAVVALSLLTAL